MKRLLTEEEKLKANALKTKVKFLPGSYDKRFCKGLAENAEYTDKQIDFLNKLYHKYRRQTQS